MRVGFLLVLLLSAAIISQSEGGWWGRVWGGIKRAARSVVKWVRNYCSISGRGFRCTYRFRRDVGNVTDDDFEESRDELCEKLLENPAFKAGLSLEMVRALFKEVDGDGDGDGEADDGDDDMDDTEYEVFIASMDVVNYCLSKRD